MSKLQKQSKELILVLGGARSGKSSYVQKQAEQIGRNVLYIATAKGDDPEMRDRIAAHKLSRPPFWITLEISRGIGNAVKKLAEKPSIIILDCLTILIANLMTGDNNLEKELMDKVIIEIDSLLDVYSKRDIYLYIVSNEVGMGIVPVYYTGRLFRDVIGKANQYIAQKADKVIFLIAGIPVNLK